MKCIPWVSYIEMANDNEVYAIKADVEGAKMAIECGAYTTNFEDWFMMNEDEILSGYGKWSGKKLWQATQKIQKEVYRMCKAQAVEEVA